MAWEGGAGGGLARGPDSVKCLPHTYSWPVISSAIATNCSVSANSCATASTIDGSLHTCERGPTLRASRCPTCPKRRTRGVSVA